MDDADKRESGASEQPPPKIKAEDNPWYLLATLFGVPELGDHELQAKNRVAWNRYFAANLDEAARAKLIEERPHPTEELAPFSPHELREVATAFAERSKASAKKLAVPDSGAHIDFSNVEFEFGVSFPGYLFSQWAVFDGASFSGGANFNGATFSGYAGFDGATFSGGAYFEGAAFSGPAVRRGATSSGHAELHGATFSDPAIFHGATFSGAAYFHGATFSGHAEFGDATFSGGADFHGATFSGGAEFDGASFSDWALFYRTTFAGWAIFEGATFSRRATFEGATFSGQAIFQGTTFSLRAIFEGATFSGHTNFGEATFGEIGSFVNAEMKRETSFEGAIFKMEPPHFFGAKLHQGTVWRGIKWPPKPKDKKQAEAFIDAYGCLKLEMDRLKKRQDELDFFALELLSRSVLLGTWKGLPFAIYGALSDYGRSYLRPLVALCMVVAIGAGAFWYFDAHAIWQALGLSAANTLNVFGFRKDFFEPAMIARLPAWLDVMSALQTILGTILLFLFGLGIRNKFRMK